MSATVLIASVVALAGALVALVFLPARPARAPEPEGVLGLEGSELDELAPAPVPVLA